MVKLVLGFASTVRSISEQYVSWLLAHASKYFDFEWDVVDWCSAGDSSWLEQQLLSPALWPRAESWLVARRFFELLELLMNLPIVATALALPFWFDRPSILSSLHDDNADSDDALWSFPLGSFNLARRFFEYFGRGGKCVLRIYKRKRKKKHQHRRTVTATSKFVWTKVSARAKAKKQQKKIV